MHAASAILGLHFLGFVKDIAFFIVVAFESNTRGWETAIRLNATPTSRTVGRLPGSLASIRMIRSSNSQGTSGTIELGRAGNSFIWRA
jgi:hypothetical protein